MSNSTYGLSPDKGSGSIQVPHIDYLPPKPQSLSPKIGVIGAGGISGIHLGNYRSMGLNVTAIADVNPEAAQSRCKEFYPQAKALSDYREILGDPDIEVVDITPHPKDRIPIVREAILAGKHVLSQKPFVLDLEEGRELVQLAEQKGVHLAVNQNGRWAPHFSYLRHAVAQGLIGDIVSVDFLAHWDHTWVKGKPAFENLHHLVLYDFAIHWFDILTCFMQERRAEWIFAAIATFPGQIYRPASQASVIAQYPGAQARMAFNAHTVCGEEDSTTIVGTRGVLRARGTGLNAQNRIELFTPDGNAIIPLTGEWFKSGFCGTMGELLCAIEQKRSPGHSAANNLASLELCFAALASAETNQPVRPGSVSKIEKI